MSMPRKTLMGCRPERESFCAAAVAEFYRPAPRRGSMSACCRHTESPSRQNGQLFTENLGVVPNIDGERWLHDEERIDPGSVRMLLAELPHFGNEFARVG